MIEHLSDPVAVASVRWFPPEAGGRRSGPPTAHVYAATVAFRTGDPAEDDPAWPASDPRVLSILLRRADSVPSTSESMCVDFLNREQARPYLHHGRRFLVLEGAQPVADAVISEVFLRSR